MIPLKAVLFDLDDTLTNRTAMFRPFSEIFVDRFLPKGGDTTRKAALLRKLDAGGTAPRPEALTALFRQTGETMRPMEEMLDFWNTVLPQCMVRMPHMFEILAWIRARGLRLGLVTNGDAKMQRSKIFYSGIGPLFDDILVSGELGIHKPDPRIFMRSLARLGVEAPQAVFVGDNLVNDIRGARAAGIFDVWMNHFGKECTPPDAPSRTARGLMELTDILDGRMGL